MDESVTELLELLDVPSQGNGLFRAAPSRDDLPRVFGGQFLGQALAAASFTVPPEWPCHSFHAYFLRPGKPGRPIDYEVSAMRDGQRFATRKVVALQRDEVAFELTASFEAEGPGPEVQEPMPEAPAPETFPPEAERIARLLEVSPPEHRRFFGGRGRPVEFIWIDPRLPDAGSPANAPVRSWMRVRGPLPDDPHLHRAALAYASDLGALEPCRRASGIASADRDALIASLDHAVWFHRPFRFDDWLLFTFRPVSVASGRGLSRGTVHARDGRMVASIVQEAVVRPRDPLVE
jgi:acyl-CoA thioesterase-2